MAVLKFISMKTVKLFSIALAAALLMLSACKKDSKEPEYVFKITPTTLNFTKDGGTRELTIKASDLWEATVEEDWCTLSAYRGDKDTVILVTAAPSTSEKDTANSITFLNAKGGYIKVTIIRDGTGK